MTSIKLTRYKPMLRFLLPALLMLFLLLPVLAQDTTPEALPPGANLSDTAASQAFRCFTGADAFLRHIEQGALNRGRQKPHDALDHYNCAVKIDPNSGIAYRGRGIAYAGLGSFQLALADYDVARDINPRDSLIYFQRGLALHQMQEDAAALEALSEAIRLDPGFALAFNWRGIVNRDLGNIERAIQDFQIAISLGVPDQIYVPYINLGNLYLNLQDNPGEAAHWFEEAARLVPGQGFIYELLGDTYFKMGRLPEAEKNYELYIQVTNTAKESVREMVEAATFRQQLLRYFPTLLILLILAYFVLVAGFRWRQAREAAQHLAQNPPPAVLSPQTVLPGSPAPSPQPPEDSTPGAGWMAVLLVPVLAGIAYVLRRIASPADETVA
jgi:tetratricopeptide (TPR) repeat protein